MEVDTNDQVQILEKKTVELASDKEYHIYVHSTKNKPGRCRSIFLLFDRDKEVVNSACLLQCTLTDEDCGEVDFDVPAHGNSKSGKKPFYPTRKSTIEAIKGELASSSASITLKKV